MNLGRGTTETRADSDEVALMNTGSELFLTVGETADLLRTTSPAIYSMIGRGQLPGVTRLGRRVLVRREDLLHWLDQSRTPSPKE